VGPAGPALIKRGEGVSWGGGYLESNPAVAEGLRMGNQERTAGF